MSKKLVALLLTVCLVMSFATVALAAYEDTDGHWAEDSINRWNGHDIIEGYEGNFDPDGTLTRAQMATIICRLLKLPVTEESFGFNDVNEDDWFAPYINACAKAGIMLGYEGNAAPNAAISREEAFVMISRALGIKPADECDKEFTDSDKVSDWAEPYINALVNAGIVDGVGDGSLAPEADINRASMMSLLDKGVAVYADEEGETVTVEEGATGVVLVVADDVKVEDAPAGTIVVTGEDAHDTTVNGSEIDNDTVHEVPEEAADLPE